MVISSIIPIGDREKAIQDELRSGGKPTRTGILINNVLGRLGLPPSEWKRKTPSGYPWWPGCLRFDLDRLRKQGKVRRPSKGYWEIVDSDNNLAAKPKPDKLSRQGLNILAGLIRDAKLGNIPISVMIRDGEITMKFGENIKQTSIEVALSK